MRTGRSHRISHTRARAHTHTHTHTAAWVLGEGVLLRLRAALGPDRPGIGPGRQPAVVCHVLGALTGLARAWPGVSALLSLDGLLERLPSILRDASPRVRRRFPLSLPKP